MKTAKMKITTIELICPDCDEPVVSDETGVMEFNINLEALPDEVTCLCGTKLKVPAKAKKLQDNSRIRYIKQELKTMKNLHLYDDIQDSLRFDEEPDNFLNAQELIEIEEKMRELMIAELEDCQCPQCKGEAA